MAPLDNGPPTIASFPQVSYFTTLPTTLAVTATDPESDITNYAWDFGDGSFTNTTAGSVQHVYAQAGSYTAKVRVTDSEWPACASTTVTITTYSPGANSPPQVGSFAATLSNGTFGLPNSTTTFSLQVADQDNDSLFIIWVFGDGKTGTSTTPASTTQRTVTASHVYTAVGRYTVTATVTDNQTGGTLPHYVTKFVNVTIQVPAAGGGGGTSAAPNPFINYGIPLGIVAIIVIAVAVAMVRRRRAAKEEERERAPPPRSPPPPPPPR